MTIIVDRTTSKRQASNGSNWRGKHSCSRRCLRPALRALGLFFSPIKHSATHPTTHTQSSHKHTREPETENRTVNAKTETHQKIIPFPPYFHRTKLAAISINSGSRDQIRILTMTRQRGSFPAHATPRMVFSG
jgi:hypothetical protein